MKWLAVTVAFLAIFWAFCAPVRAENLDLPDEAPMPAERPLDAPRRESDPRPRAPKLVAIPQEDADAAAKLCAAVLAKDKLVAAPAEAAMWDNGCGAAGQIKISAIKRKDGKDIALRPAALIRCETAEAVADWIRDEVVPATEAYSGLSRVEVAASYHCRPRNNIRGARMSEHGRANAIDIRAIVMNDGRRFGVDLQETPLQLLYDLRRGACAHFTTVLGPGSDGYHENHFHLDLAQRRNGYRICQWNVPAPPVPAPNPLRVRYP